MRGKPYGDRLHSRKRDGRRGRRNASYGRGVAPSSFGGAAMIGITLCFVILLFAAVCIGFARVISELYSIRLWIGHVNDKLTRIKAWGVEPEEKRKGAA